MAIDGQRGGGAWVLENKRKEKAKRLALRALYDLSLNALNQRHRLVAFISPFFLLFRVSRLSMKHKVRHGKKRTDFR